MDVAALAVPCVADGNGVAVFQNCTEPFCALVLQEDPACSSFIYDEFAQFATMLAYDKNIAAHVRHVHAKQLSDKKRVLTVSYSSVLGFGSTAIFTAFFKRANDAATATVRAYRDFFIKTLGIGGVANGNY